MTLAFEILKYLHMQLLLQNPQAMMLESITKSVIPFVVFVVFYIP